MRKKKMVTPSSLYNFDSSAQLYDDKDTQGQQVLMMMASVRQLEEGEEEEEKLNAWSLITDELKADGNDDGESEER